MFVFLPQRHRVRDAERCDGLHPPEVQAACSEETVSSSARACFECPCSCSCCSLTANSLSNYVYMVCLCPFSFVFGAASCCVFVVLSISISWNFRSFECATASSSLCEFIFCSSPLCYRCFRVAVMIILLILHSTKYYELPEA